MNWYAEIDTSDFDRALDTLTGRMSKPGSDPVLSAGLLAGGDRLLGFYRRRFLSSEANGWPPLAPSTVRQKKRKGTYHKGTLRDTDQLYNSFVPGAPSNVRRIVADTAVIGTSDRTASRHQTGTSRMPARPVVVDAPRELQQIITVQDIEPAVDRLCRIIFPNAA